MFRGLPTESLPITKLFDRPYVFKVPAYQRPYSWTRKEAGQLLDDLLGAAGLTEDGEPSPDYFLGTILLLDPTRDIDNSADYLNGLPIFDIVDGQQRLITIAILACVLRDFHDQNDSGIEGVEVADRLHERLTVPPVRPALFAHIGRYGSTCRIKLREGQNGFLADAVSARGRGGAGGSTSAEAISFEDTQIETVHRHMVDEIASLSAQAARKLSLYLLEECHVVVIVSRDIDHAHRIFTVLNERGKPLDRKDILKAEMLCALPPQSSRSCLAAWDRASDVLGDEFESFLSHLRLIHGLQRFPIIASVRLLVREHGSERFLSDMLCPLAEAFGGVRSPSSSQAQTYPVLAASLSALNRLGRSDWVPAAILAMRGFASDGDYAQALIVKIERLAYLLRLLGLGAGRRQRRFSPIVEALHAGKRISPQDALWAITKDESRTVAFHLKDLHKRNAPMCKLLLMRIEDAMAGASLAVDPKDLTVEHVLPLRPAASSDWRRTFPDADQRVECQASLGNLALISERQNDKAKNRDFGEKRVIYGQLDRDALPLKINADILTSDVWLPETIAARQARLVGVIERLWEIDFSA